MSCVIRLLHIMRHPDLVSADHVQINGRPEPCFGAVYTRCVTAAADCLAERPAYRRTRRFIQSVRAPVTIRRKFRIDEYRQAHTIPLHHRESHRCFFHRFHLIDCLAEEIYTYLQTCCRSPLDIAPELRVLYQHTTVGTTISASDDDKFNAGRLHCAPVDRAVPFGHVDTDHHTAVICGCGCRCRRRGRGPCRSRRCRRSIVVLQHTVRAKAVLDTLDLLIPGHLFAVAVKIVGIAVDHLPSRISILCIAQNVKL